MEKRYFGTDGVRGLTNKPPMTAETALRLGQAAGRYFRRDTGRRHSVVIGKDTRLSGYMIETALVAGFTSVGMDVFQFGPLPTPGVAMMTRSLRADLGVMISASHNAYHDNGIKLFGPDAYKLDDSTELEIESLMDRGLEEELAPADKLGRAKRVDDAQARYVEIVKATLPRRLRLNGLRVVVDCANGAAYKVAPAALWELGAEVISVGVSPNGFNINDEVGSTHPGAMAAKVKEMRADIGLALDGDADRIIVCDEHGEIVDGDQILALIARSWHKRERLARPGIVATIMSNLGLERCLKEDGLALERVQVGDRYVVEKMRADGYNLGGEQSGHVVLSDFATTGDGLMAALQVLAAMVEADKPASQILRQFEPAPQILKNVRYKSGAPLEADEVKEAIREAEAELGDSGRLVIRKSGTEPLIRIMAEGDDARKVEKIVDSLVETVGRAA
ncbi:MAG: phosphoglucosamine mutase [Euryhalocaulis sp.]|uniref:phosphoglucosamine mutase n=1 Tax=Euryhalocaulis sp. TaxID=2744307 RepID=UPI00179E15F9|nr:phosphoglucosamine mutase [Euryhalocaulis sp.]MBA4801821.1 phosphoglucosamine mutase [Euryhalocaulis sp.]